MPVKPRRPWHVILTQNGIQVAETDHPTQTRAFEHARTALRANADTARVMQWADGRWWHFDTMHTDDLPPTCPPAPAYSPRRPTPAGASAYPAGHGTVTSGTCRHTSP